MINDLLFKLDIIAPLIVLLFVAVLLVQRKSFGSFSNYILTVFVALQFFLNALAGYLQYIQINNLWVYHLNCQLTHLVFSYYFLCTLGKKRFVYAGLFLFVIVDVILLFSIQPYHVFPSYAYALSSFILVIYALMLLNVVIAKIPTFHILSLKEFWLAAGVLMYFGSGFLIFVSYHYLSEVAPKSVYILWQVHNVFIAISCIIFLKAMTSKQWIQE